MNDPEPTEWPREIWMAERDEHDQGVVSAVLSEHATVARWKGDKERDREFHRYVDADIHENAERYHAAKREELIAERDRLRHELEAADAMIARLQDYLAELRAAAEPAVSFTFADRVAAGETDHNIAREWTAIKRPLRNALRNSTKEARALTGEGRDDG